MIPPLIIRFLMLVLGYVLPAYSCYKLLESGRHNPRHFHRWSQYWVIIAMFTAIQFISDPFLFWFPLYWEAKLALICFLLFPNMEGTDYVYTRYLQPHLSRHEGVIDQNVEEIRQRIQFVAMRFWTGREIWVRERVRQFVQFAVNNGLVDARELVDENRNRRSIHGE